MFLAFKIWERLESAHTTKTEDLVTFAKEIVMENFIFLCSVIFTLLYSDRNLFAEFIVRFQSICFPEQFLAATSDARNFCIISKYTTISNRRIMRPMFRKYLSKQLVLANFPFYLLLSGISKKEHKKVTSLP